MAVQTPSITSHTKAAVQMVLATRPMPMATRGKDSAIRVGMRPAIFNITHNQDRSSHSAIKAPVSPRNKGCHARVGEGT